MWYAIGACRFRKKNSLVVSGDNYPSENMRFCFALFCFGFWGGGVVGGLFVGGGCSFSFLYKALHVGGIRTLTIDFCFKIKRECSNCCAIS